MNEEHSRMVMEEACRAESMRYEAATIEYETAIRRAQPNVIYKPRLYPDGNQWCALLVHTTHAAQASATHCAAVVGIFTADQDVLVRLAFDSPVLSNHTDNRIDCFRS